MSATNMSTQGDHWQEVLDILRRLETRMADLERLIRGQIAEYHAENKTDDDPRR